jgi:phosphate/sulfate permease
MPVIIPTCIRGGRIAVCIIKKVSGPGCLSVMLGSALWQLFASFLGWPVSGSHSIVSGLLGFTLVAKGKQLDHGKYCG